MKKTVDTFGSIVSMKKIDKINKYLALFWFANIVIALIISYVKITFNVESIEQKQINDLVQLCCIGVIAQFFAYMFAVIFDDSEETK